jgi:predicted enzyme related to lactoylglutathione lyase
MAHRSRLGTIVIDCQGDGLDEAVRFWSGALGYRFRIDPSDERYAVAEAPAGLPQILLQQVEHPSRVHLDLETDDKEAERARLEAEGATVVERHRKGWIIMEAPTGQRFCLVGPQRGDLPDTAREYD